MKIKVTIQATAYIMRLVLYVMLLPFLGYWFHNRNCTINRIFCYNMCAHYSFRVVYVLVFANGIAAFNLGYYLLTKDMAAISMPMAVSWVFLSECARHSLIATIRRNNQLLFAIMLIALAALFTPHMLCFTVSLYLLLVATAFYPSRQATDRLKSPQDARRYRRELALSVDTYFR